MKIFFLKTVTLWLLFAALNLSVCIASGSGVLIIANKEVKKASLTRAEIKNIFLGHTTFWEDNSKITFVTLEKSDVHKSFVSQYVQKSTDQFRAFWRRQLFIGKGMIPLAFKTEQEMVDFIAKTRGAIGYVSSSAKTNSVKIITVSDK